MELRWVVVATAVPALFACRPAASVPRPIGEARTSSARAPSGTVAPSSIAQDDERDNRQLCGYPQLPSIPFERESILVTPEEDAILERLAVCFTAPAMQSATIVLIGRAAEPSRPDCSAELGLRRSERVKEFLVGHGVPSDRVVAVSAGDRETPIAIATPRVDFVLAFPRSGARSTR
jgi:outer membrane protein OmpA-like peptidoglycan-associated protein